MNNYIVEVQKMHICSFFLILFCGILVGCVSIKSLVPQGGQEGSEIEIIGDRFSTDITANQVNFGAIEAEVLDASAETLRVRVPPGAVRSKIKVTRGLFNSDESETDFIPLPDYIQYRRFESTILGITQGFWIMYPPSFSEPDKRFPVVYALHGYNFGRNPISGNVGDVLEELGLTNLGGTNEHSWMFGVSQAGIYFPFIARSMMEASTVDELRTLLTGRITAAAGDQDIGNVGEVVDSIIHYLPSDPDTWLPIAEMVIVLPDGDNSWYTDRLGPPEGRNDGLGAEPSFPTSSSINPARRFDPHVTGWYEQYLIDELIGHIETTDIGEDKLVEEGKRRYLMGISMGGYGSLKLALKHQDEFIATAALSASPSITSENILIKNLLIPEVIDVFGSAPVRVGAGPAELGMIALDEDYLSANNPIDLVDSSDTIDLHVLIEIGENDGIEAISGNTIALIETFLVELHGKALSVQGDIVPAAAAGEPSNGNAAHSPEFWRTRLGSVLKFFSDI